MVDTPGRESDPAGPRFSLADALLLLTVAIWGVNFSVVKFALAEMSPLAFNSVRFLIAAAVMAFLTRGWQSAAPGRSRPGRSRPGRSRPGFERRHLPWLIGLGLLSTTLYQILFIFGAAATSADNAALMLATVPAWVAFLGTLIGLERVRPAGWLGIGLSLAGIALIVLGSDRSASFHFGGPTLAGDALMLAATLCWSLATLLNRLAIHRYGTLPVTRFSMLVGAVPLILLGLPDLVRDGGDLSAGAWLAAASSGLFAIALAYLLWNYGIGRLGSARTALYSNLTPPFALATAWLWLGETLTLVQAGGGLLALAGVVLARRYARPRDLGRR